MLQLTPQFFHGQFLFYQQKIGPFDEQKKDLSNLLEKNETILF